MTTSQLCKGGPLSRLAAMLGANPAFPQFVLSTFGEDAKTPDDCATVIRYVCRISSRAELDHNKHAEVLFHEKIRKPFIEFYERQSNA